MIVGEGRVGKTSLKQAMIEVLFSSFRFDRISILQFQNKRVVVGEKETASTRGADPAVTVQGVIGSEGSVFKKVLLFIIIFVVSVMLLSDGLSR